MTATNERIYAPTSGMIYYDVAMQRLATQVQQISDLDARAGQLLSVSGGAVPVFGGLLLFAGKLSHRSIQALGVAGVLFVVLTVLVVLAYRTRGYSLRPDLPTLAAHSDELDDVALRWWVADECASSFDGNRAVISRKLRYVRWATVCFGLLSTTLTVGALLTLR